MEGAQAVVSKTADLGQACAALAATAGPAARRLDAFGPVAARRPERAADLRLAHPDAVADVAAAPLDGERCRGAGPEQSRPERGGVGTLQEQLAQPGLRLQVLTGEQHEAQAPRREQPRASAR